MVQTKCTQYSVPTCPTPTHLPHTHTHTPTPTHALPPTHTHPRTHTHAHHTEHSLPLAPAVPARPLPAGPVPWAFVASPAGLLLSLSLCASLSRALQQPATRVGHPDETARFKADVSSTFVSLEAHTARSAARTTTHALASHASMCQGEDHAPPDRSLQKITPTFVV